MAIGPSDTLLGEGQPPRRRDLPATFEANPVRSGPPGQPMPMQKPAARPSAGGQGRSGPGPSPAPAAPSLTPGQAVGTAVKLAQGLARPETVANTLSTPVGPSPLSKGGSFGLLAPGLTARERGQEFREGVAGIGRDIANTASGAWNSFAAASDAVVRPVSEFVQGAAGVEPQRPSLRETMVAAQREREQRGGPGSSPQVSMQAPPPPVPSAAPATARPKEPKLLPEVVPAAAPGQQAAPMNTIIGADGKPRAVQFTPEATGGPVALTAQQPPQIQAPALPAVPAAVASADPARTRAGDEATRSVMQEIESQLFRNSFAAGRGSRSARGLQGQLTQALAGLAPTLGASADAADARNVQARTALAQTQAQQNAAQLQAQAALGANDRRAQAAELVAQIGAGARPPTLLTGEQGAFSIGPNGQAVPVLAPDGSQVKPAGGGGQGIRPDTLFKEFNGRLNAIQGDPTLSPEVKEQQIRQLYADPLFQGLAQYLQPSQ